MDMSKYELDGGIYFHKGTPAAVRRALKDAWQKRYTVRLWFGDQATGRAWDEENDVLGRIGRSMGPVHVPLLVAPGELGGGHLLDHCIVRIDRVTRRRNSEANAKARTSLVGETLYQHPSFHAGTWETTASDDPGYRVAVMRDGELVARFKNDSRAKRYIAFMTGDDYRRDF